VKELEMPALKRVFITHLHSDHTVGLPDLMLSPWVLERKDPLAVMGPPGIAKMVSHLSEAYAEDIEIRLHGLEPSNKTGYRAAAEDVTPGVVYRGDGMTVTAFAVPHGNWTHAYGYTFETDERRVVVSGDAMASDETVSQCNGCDVLVHEVYSAEAFKTRPPEWQNYHSHFHTSTRELAELATRARPKLLLLYHQLYWGKNDVDLVREVKRAGYKGRVLSAKDLGVY
jgi:ribonuclease BN (tRNA processing enzyme)